MAIKAGNKIIVKIMSKKTIAIITSITAIIYLLTAIVNLKIAGDKKPTQSIGNDNNCQVINSPGTNITCNVTPSGNNDTPSANQRIPVPEKTIKTYPSNPVGLIPTQNPEPRISNPVGLIPIQNPESQISKY